MWRKVDNDDTRQLWTCPDCTDEIYIYPDWYQDNGTPVCNDCGCDMIYSYTEINCNHA